MPRQDPEGAVPAGGMTGRHPSRRLQVLPRAFRPAAAAVAFVLALLAGAQALAASSAAVTVSAVILTRSNCRFITGAAALPFGDLDPGNPVNVTLSVPVRFRCNGGPPTAVYLVTDDDGMYETGPDARRMRHATLPGTYLPYEFSVSPASGTIPRNTPQTLTVTGTVRGTDYQGAAAGDYADTVVVSINP